MGVAVLTRAGFYPAIRRNAQQSPTSI
jgi:hypothetical protein